MPVFCSSSAELTPQAKIMMRRGSSMRRRLSSVMHLPQTISVRCLLMVKGAHQRMIMRLLVILRLPRTRDLLLRKAIWVLSIRMDAAVYLRMTSRQPICSDWRPTKEMPMRKMCWELFIRTVAVGLRRMTARLANSTSWPQTRDCLVRKPTSAFFIKRDAVVCRRTTTPPLGCTGLLQMAKTQVGALILQTST